MTAAHPQAERIAVLVKRFPRLSETFIMNEFLELRRSGVPIELYAIMDPHETRSHPEALALATEVKYLRTGDSIWEAAPAVLRTLRRHPLGMLRAIGWTITRHTRAAARNLVYAAVLVDKLAASQPAHLHAHFLHSPAALALIAHKINGQRYSLSGHAKDIYTTLNENLQLRCNPAEFVTTCTGANVRHLLDEVGIAPDLVHLCRHGVDVERFGVARAERVAGRIVSIGRLVPKKGHDVLVRACGALARSGVAFELRIVGSGPLREELEALAAAEGIADRVTLLGSCSQDEVVSELGSAELFALSPVILPDGDRDGIPNVLMEAMATGLPVVTTAVSGIPEILTDGRNARLVQSGSNDAFATVLAELLADADQRARLGAAGREFVREECAWPRAIQPLRELMVAQLKPGAADPNAERASVQDVPAP